MPWLYFAGLALIVGTAAFIGAVPTKIYGHDIFIYLGNGWRVLQGQRPHVDFTSPWGPVGFLISALGLMLSRNSADGIGFGTAIMALIVGVWSFVLGYRRLHPILAVIFGFLLALLVAAPYSLGISPFLSSHAMIYNRYGYALLGLIFLDCFNPPVGSSTPRAMFATGFSTGLALSLELFLKASYFFLGLAFIGFMTLLLGSLPRRRVLGIVAGFVLVSLCVLAYLRFDLWAVVNDLRMAAGARAETMPSLLLIARLHPATLVCVIGMGITAALYLSKSSRWHGFRLPVLGAFIACADVSAIASNAQVRGFPISAMFALLVTSEILADRRADVRLESLAHWGYGVLALCAGSLLFVPQFARDLTGLAYGASQKLSPSHPEGLLRFTSPNLKPLLLYESDDNPPSEGRMFTSYVNDGVALLRKETTASETVLTMDVTNPFPYAMERRPPRGGHASPTYHYNMTDRYRPSEEWFFGDADIVMVPKRASQGDNHYLDFFRAYASWLKERYYLAAETQRWWMYRRRQ